MQNNLLEDLHLNIPLQEDHLVTEKASKECKVNWNYVLNNVMVMKSMI